MTLDEQYRRMMMEAKGTDPDQKFICWFGANLDLKHSYDDSGLDYPKVTKSLGKIFDPDDIIIPEKVEKLKWKPRENVWPHYSPEDSICVIPRGPDAGIGFNGNVSQIDKVLSWLKKHSTELNFCRVELLSVDQVGLAMINDQWDYMLSQLSSSHDFDYAEKSRNKFIEFLETNDPGNLNSLIGKGLSNDMDEALTAENGPIVDGRHLWKYPYTIEIEGDDFNFSSISKEIKKISKEAIAAVNYDKKKGWKKFGKYITDNIQCNFPKLDVFKYITLTGEDIPNEEFEYVRNKLTGSNEKDTTNSNKVKEIPAPKQEKPEMPLLEPRDEIEVDVDDSEKLSESIRRIRELAGILKG
jgi:hypothetical protein